MPESELHEGHHLLSRQPTQDSDYSTLDVLSNTQPAEPKSEQRAFESCQRQHSSRHSMARLSRYLPFIKWIPEYRWEWFPGDFMGALTVASLYVPLSVSFALMGHAHPISGLYSFVVNPLLYALLGTCPLMVVGPEAPGSILVGAVVAASRPSNEADENGLISAQIAGTVTAFTGVMLLASGIGRLGYVNSILSPPFMRGIIGALGFNVVVQNTLTGLGIGALAQNNSNVANGSPARKFMFILANLGQTHLLTAAVSITSFIIVMVIRHFRSSLELRHHAFAYVPDKFVVIASSAVLTVLLKWQEQGLEVLGHIQAPDNFGVPFHWPFTFKQIDNISNLITTAFLITLLGLFESSLTAKSLRKASGGQNATSLRLDADQELIALGAANILGGCFLALPGFGGYGRSKLNFATGGRTPMSNVLVSVMALTCILGLLPAFYYLPRGVLAAMIAVVGVSMIEECPHEIAFFIKIRAWPELTLMTLVFGATIFHSVSLGMALGLGWSTVALFLHGGWHSTVHILDSHSLKALDNAEFAQIATLSSIRTILVTVPDPLTFANASNLKDQLAALDHTAIPLPSASHHSASQAETKAARALIVDMRHCTRLDGCAVQVLTEIAEHHPSEDSKIIIWEPLQLHGRDSIQDRLTWSGAAEVGGGDNISFVSSLEEILTTLEVEGRPESIFEQLDT